MGCKLESWGTDAVAVWLQALGVELELGEGGEGKKPINIIIYYFSNSFM